MIVVDASAAIRWFKPATGSGPPAGMPRTSQPLVAPDLFVAEIRSAVLVYRRKNGVTPGQAGAIVETIDRIMTGYFPLHEARDAAWAMALAYDHSPHDCFYIELARRLGSYLVTADDRLVRKFAKTPLKSHVVAQSDWRPQ